MGNDSPYILAVDLGTSGCKAALVTVKGQVAAWHFESIPTLFSHGGGAEQDPEDWWGALIKCARALHELNVCGREDIVAVCCNTQGEGTVAVDSQGRHLANAILWMDTRGAEYLKEINRGLIKIAGYGAFRVLRWIRLTGGAPSLTGKDPASHMLLIKHKWPDVYRRTHKFLNVLDYMNLRLTGRCVATADSILTSWVTDNRDANHIKYSDTLLRHCMVDPDKFPEIVASTEVLGPLTAEAARDLDLSPRTQVVAGAIDTTAAAVGSGAVADYATHLYVGTSSWMAAHLPHKKTDLLSSMASVPCAVPGKYLLIGLQSTAGGNLTFLRDKLLYHKDDLLQEEHLPDVYKVMDRLAEDAPPGSNGVIYGPWIFGERAPIDDRHVRACLFNLSLDTSRPDIVRSIFEGVALNTRWLLEPFERFMGRQTGPINVVGGGAKSDVWCRIFADVLRRPVRQMKNPIEANVRGSAYIAAFALGHTTFEEIPRLTEVAAEYLPREETRAIYEDVFREFTALYRQNRGIFKRLNGKKLPQGPGERDV